jgi:hypothetical protein
MLDWTGEKPDCLSYGREGWSSDFAARRVFSQADRQEVDSVRLSAVEERKGRDGLLFFFEIPIPVASESRDFYAELERRGLA